MLADIHDVVERVKNGDQSAFRMIVEEYRQMAFSLAFRILCNEEEARDVVQESFIKIWQNISSYKAEQKFSTWMCKIIINSAIDRMRQIKKQHYLEFSQLVRKIDAMNMENDMKAIENKEMAALIGWMAEELPQKQKMVFILRDLQGIESSEVQQILQMPETQVKSNLYHARLAIREKLIKELKQ